MRSDVSPRVGGAEQVQKRGLFKGANTPVPLEGIVVIVILTVLVAVMVFSFAGFANEAKDERYAFEAREHVIAVRAVLSESFATNAVSPVSAPAVEGPEDAAFKAWHLARLSEYARGDSNLFRREAEKLFGGMPSPAGDFGYWELWLTGPSSAATFWDAEGFLFEIWSDDHDASEAGPAAGSAAASGAEPATGAVAEPATGPAAGSAVAPTTEPVVYVTYRMDRIEAADADEFVARFWEEAAYNPSAGYEVYRFADSSVFAR